MSSQQEGVVHITPRPRRQSHPVDYQSKILQSSTEETYTEPPNEYFTKVPTMSSSLSKDGSFVIPETSETVLEEQKEVMLKRRSSWRKFKDTLVGWVSGGINNSQTEDSTGTQETILNRSPKTTPRNSLPNDSSLVIEDAEALLKTTNCYSSSKKTPYLHDEIQRAPQPSTIPKIIVTCEKQKAQEEDIRKQMAVAKIKQAITSMNSNEDISQSVPNDNREVLDRNAKEINKRRHSEIFESRRKGSGGELAARRGSGSHIRRSHSARAPKTKPMIWEHFEAVPHNTTIGKCRECHMAVSCKYNTGQFVRHLQNSHKDVYRKYQSKMDSQWTKSVIERNLK